MAHDYVQTVAQALIAQLKAGTAPWIKPWQPGARFMPYNPTTGHAYRGMNAMWLMTVGPARGYDDARWMTYKQAQGAGAQVRRGEQGTLIQYWQWQGLAPVTDANGQPVLDDAGKQQQQTVQYERPRVLSAVVFNAAQIDGLPPPQERTRSDRMASPSRISARKRPRKRRAWPARSRCSRRSGQKTLAATGTTSRSCMARTPCATSR
jgi:antirestriction protein ArdC